MSGNGAQTTTAHAIVTTSSPKPIHNDDEGTLQYLLSLQSTQSEPSELQDRLETLQSRLRQFQHPFGSTFWSNLLADVSMGSLKPIHDEIATPMESKTSASSTEDQTNLASLRSYPNGSLHVQSLSSLLHISAEEATHLTYLSLKDQNNIVESTSNKSELSSYQQSLLGSSHFITYVQQFYIQEYVARLRSVAECLRLEVEGDDAEEDDERHHNLVHVKKFLDELDRLYQIQWTPQTPTTTKDGNDSIIAIGKHDESSEIVQSRGLFRMLLVSACCGVPGNTDSNSTHTNPVEEAALETLLVLFYGKRMNGQLLTRWDFMMLLSALESKEFFGNYGHGSNETIQKGGRMPELVALICAEVLSLWTFTSSSFLESPHFLLRDMNDDCENMKNDVQSILQLLGRNAINVNKRLERQMMRATNLSPEDDCVQAPEAVALFSFGLLLILAQSKYSDLDESTARFLRENGMKSIREANDKYGAFVYLEWILRTLLPPQNTEILNKDKDGNFHFGAIDMKDSEVAGIVYDDAGTVVYSSIAREIINATITAFYLTDGAKLSKLPVADIKMLSTLIAMSYRSQTTSRISFWNTWYDHIHKDAGNNSNNSHALCFLIDGAHQLAIAAMKNHSEDMTKLFPSIAPLLKLVSALVCDVQTMTFALEGIADGQPTPGVNLLPPFVITTVITLCANLHHQHIYTMKNGSSENLEFISELQSILSSISLLAQTGGQHFFSLVVHDFEKHYGDPILLPSNLYLIAVNAPESEIAHDALMILSLLLQNTQDDRPLSTSLNLATSQCIEGYGSNPDGFTTFLPVAPVLHSSNETSSYRAAMALMNILNSLCSKVCDVITSSSSSKIVESYIKTILSGTIMGCDIVSKTSTSKKQFTHMEGRQELELNLLCIQAISNSLRCLQPFLLNTDPVISSACNNARHSIIYKLAATPDLGQIIAAHAALPVASALRGTLRARAWKEKNESNEDEKKKENRFGAWEMFAIKSIKGGGERIDFDDYKNKLVESIDLVDLEMGFMKCLVLNQCTQRTNDEKKYIYEMTLLKLIACEATTLLLLWTKFAHEIYVDCNENGSSAMANDEPGIMNHEDFKSLSPVWKVLMWPSLMPTSRIEKYEGGKMKMMLQHYANDQVGSIFSIGGSFWPKNLTWLTLISRYVVLDSCIRSYSSLPLVPAMELLTLINNETSSISCPTSNGINLSLNGGKQIHRMLLTCLERYFDTTSFDKKNARFLFRALTLLSSSIRSNSNFAATLLLGSNLSIDIQKQGSDLSGIENKNPRVCELIMKSIEMAASKISAESELISDEDIAIASQAVTCIVMLYEFCRNQLSEKEKQGYVYSSNPCTPALKYFLEQKDFFTFLFKLLSMPPALLQSSKERMIIDHTRATENAFDESMYIFDRRRNAIYLHSSIMRIISKEVFTSLASSNNERGSVLQKGIATYLNVDEVETIIESHHLFDITFSQFDGIALAAEKYQLLRKAFKKVDMERELIVLQEDKYENINDITTMESEECICLQRVIPARHVAYKRLTSSWLDFLNASKLANIQEHYIESWRHFIEVSFLTLFKETELQGPFLSVGSETMDKNLNSANVKTKLFTGTSNKKETLSGLLWSVSAVHHIVETLEKHYKFTNEATMLNTSPPYVQKNVIGLSTACDAAKIATELLESMLSSIHYYMQSFPVSKTNYSQEIRHSFYDLMHVAERLFALIKPSQFKSTELTVIHNSIVNAEVGRLRRKGLMLGCRLRLQVLSIALIFLDIINSFDTKETTKTDEKREFECRLLLADLACDSLSLVKYCHDTKKKVDPFEYNYHTLDEDATQPVFSFDLLSASLAVLNSLLITQSPKSMFGLSTSNYFSDLTTSLRRWRAVPTILEHFSFASDAAATTYKTDPSRLHNNSASYDETASIHERSLSVMSRILHFAVLACSCESTIDVAFLLFENDILMLAIINNPLFRRVGQNWTSLSNSGNHDLRGYLLHAKGAIRSRKMPKQKNGALFSSRQPQHDPVHMIWRLTLRTVTSILGIQFQAKRGLLDSGMDFFCAYDDVILSAISGGFDDFNQSNSPHPNKVMAENEQSNSSSRPVFTPNNLLESISSLSLLSELYKSPRIQQFENFSSPSAQNKILATVRFSIRSLSAFIGSSGISRELFEAVSTLNRDMENANSTASPSRAFTEQQLQHALNMSPIMIAGGVPNARHDAVNNAHYAKSSARCVTSEDFVQSEKVVDGVKPEENIRENSLEGFHNHVNNEFSFRMERYASKALYNALSILTRALPASSSFILFDSHEAERMDPSTFVRVGATIALRPRKISKFKPNLSFNKDIECDAPVRYAKVVQCHNEKKIWDVQYLSITGRENENDEYANSHESNVAFTRLAGIQDITQKKSVLSYAAAPKSPVLAFSSDISIGHLVLILRWCKERVGAYCKENKKDNDFILLGCLTNLAALFLVREVKVHNELAGDKNKGGNEAKLVNTQIYELFGEIMRDKESAHVLETGSAKKTGLENVLDKKTVEAILLHLEKQLSYARDEHAAILQDRFGKGLSPGPGSGRRRRSPFRGYGMSF